MSAMRVVANLDLCQGHARCAQICPELFTTDVEQGKVVLRQVQIPADLEEQARLAVANCPEGALRLARNSGSGS